MNSFWMGKILALRTPTEKDMKEIATILLRYFPEDVTFTFRQVEFRVENGKSVSFVRKGKKVVTVPGTPSRITATFQGLPMPDEERYLAYLFLLEEMQRAYPESPRQTVNKMLKNIFDNGPSTPKPEPDPERPRDDMRIFTTYMVFGPEELKRLEKLYHNELYGNRKSEM